MSHCSKKFNMISSEFNLALSIDVQLLNSSYFAMWYFNADFKLLVIRPRGLGLTRERDMSDGATVSNSSFSLSQL